MGALRFLLATYVVLAHFPPWWSGFRPLMGGEMAVEIFFMISGFYMSLVLTGKYRNADATIRTQDFYVARALRIFPAYWAVLAFMCVWTIAERAAIIKHAIELGPVYTAWAVFSNIFILGQDALLFAKVTDAGTVLVDALGRVPIPQPYHLALIAPAWTLSLELMFYCLAPWFSRRSTAFIVSIIALSSVARFTAYQAGYDGDPWRYRFFPFELALFLAGMLSHRMYISGKLRKWRYATGLPVMLVVLAIVPDIRISHISVIGSFTLLSAFFALPRIFHWKKNSKIDRAVGELSYPVYLIHLPVLIVCSKWLSGQNEWFDALVILICVLCSSIALEYINTRYLDDWARRGLGLVGIARAKHLSGSQV
jgi:peptidoglycan/LPS O-acetylase OafA/YrhL